MPEGVNSESQMEQPLIILMGCTACGKGTIGRALAGRIDAEILSVDSMKVYRRMDVGTAKPTTEQRQAVRHHMIDVVEPSESFSAAQYADLADQAIVGIRARGRRVLAVGGTVFYLKALTEGLFEGPAADPSIREELRRRGQEVGWAMLHKELQAADPLAAERIHPNDARRIVRALEVYRLTGRPISALQTQWRGDQYRYPGKFIGLRRRKDDQNHRINRRVRRMIDLGLVEEVRALLNEPLPLSTQAAQAVGYAEIIRHRHGECSLDEAIERIKINTRQLAKSQRTWFRRFRNVTWLDLTEDQDLGRLAVDLADRILTGTL